MVFATLQALIATDKCVDRVIACLLDLQSPIPALPACIPSVSEPVAGLWFKGLKFSLQRVPATGLSKSTDRSSL